MRHLAGATAFTMPAFAWRLSDAEVADVVSFVRSSWGNQALAVEATEVAAVRTAQKRATTDQGGATQTLATRQRAGCHAARWSRYQPAVKAPPE